MRPQIAPVLCHLRMANGAIWADLTHGPFKSQAFSLKRRRTQRTVGGSELEGTREGRRKAPG